jgi:DNA-binding LytR/AlgR family response regulator
MRARALIVDDEAPARAELRYLMEGFDHVQVVGEATNGEEALVLLRTLPYDLLLLDIRMPGGTGLEVAATLRELPHPPKVIFTTAYSDHAADAFDVAAADYLLKPFDADRLGRALDRALSNAADDAVPPPSDRLHPRAGEPLVRIPVQRDERTVRFVDHRAVVYARAARGYSYLNLTDERLLVCFTLNELARRLPVRFFRTHRSYLVNLDHVREFAPGLNGGLVLVMGDQQRSRIEVSRRQARELRRRFRL